MTAGKGAHSSGLFPVSRVRRLTGTALLGLALTLALSSLAGPALTGAGAATITPCSAGPIGPIITLDGEGTLEMHRPGAKMLRRAKVRRSLIHPANSLTGRPTFPVRKVRLGKKTSKVWLKGGMRFRRGKRQIAARAPVAVVPRNRGKAVRVTAKLGGNRIVLFRLRGERRTIRPNRGELDVIHASARFGAKAVKRINRRLGIRKARKNRRLRPAVKLGRFDLSATHFVANPGEDPEAETPDPPPVAGMPADALPVTTATIRWELRDSWIDYVNSGETPKPRGGVEPGSPRPPKNLVYTYTFPFAAGWTTPDAGTGDGASLVKGAGSLGFRFCEHTINFIAAEPEIELSDDDHSRLIFRVDGTDGTAFPDQRVVMVRLRPSKAEGGGVRVTEKGDGTRTLSWTKIPGYIPAEGTGIFANFYPAYDPSRWGTLPHRQRPDRFGYLSVDLTYQPTEP